MRLNREVLAHFTLISVHQLIDIVVEQSVVIYPLG